MQATFTNGNKEITVTVKSSKEWSKEGSKRVYFELECTGKRQPIATLYEIVEGSSRDKVVTANGRKFGYQYGIDANSNAKRDAVDAAILELVSALSA